MSTKLKDIQIHNPQTYAGHDRQQDSVLSFGTPKMTEAQRKKAAKDTLDHWSRVYQKTTGRKAFWRPGELEQSLKA